MDEVDLVESRVTGWRDALPDLDTDAMRTFLLMARVMAHGRRLLEAGFAPHGLSVGEFDVLASLRHAPDQRLKPGALARDVLLSPAGMTNRIDRLAAAGFVERQVDPTDRRSPFVVLTEAGREVVEAAVHDHVAIERAVLDALTEREHAQFDGTLQKLLAQLSPQRLRSKTAE